MKKFIKSTSVLTLILAIVLSFTGCGEIKKAETTVDKMFIAFKELNFEEANKYVDVDSIKTADGEEDLAADAEIFMKSLFGKLDHKIVSSEKVDSNTVNVTTEITAIDMKPVLGNFLTAALQYAFSAAFAGPQPSEEETNKKMEELFIEAATKPDLTTVTNTVVIKVTKQDKAWKVNTDDAFIDAVFGGLQAATKELENSLNSKD